MEFSGTQQLAAPIETVWTFLLDVNNVAACAPGFQSLEVLGEEHWKVIAGVKIGAVNARFNLDVTRPEIQAPDHMVVKGRGKAPGSAVDVTGTMHLQAVSSETTELIWKAEVQISGALASIGGRLMNSAVDRLTGQFFACLQEKLQTSSREKQ